MTADEKRLIAYATKTFCLPNSGRKELESKASSFTVVTDICLTESSFESKLKPFVKGLRVAIGAIMEEPLAAKLECETKGRGGEDLSGRDMILRTENAFRRSWLLFLKLSKLLRELEERSSTRESKDLLNDKSKAWLEFSLDWSRSRFSSAEQE